LFGYGGASQRIVCDELAKHPNSIDCVTNLNGYITFARGSANRDKYRSPAVALSIFLLSVVDHLTDALSMGMFEVPDLERYWDEPACGVEKFFSNE
jgi:hypothetical protein